MSRLVLTSLATDLERARVLVDRDDIEIIKPFVVGGRLEPLARREDGNIRHPGTSFAHTIAAQGVTRICRKEVTCNLRAVATGAGDDERAIGRTRIGIVDDYRAACGKTGIDQFLLTPLWLPDVSHRILADQVVCGGKAFTVERALA